MQNGCPDASNGDEATSLLAKTTDTPAFIPSRTESELPLHFVSRIRKRLASRLVKHFLPIGFSVAILFSVVWPDPGRSLSNIKTGDVAVMQALCVCVVFIVSGLAFSTSDIKGAVQSIQGILFGSFAILFLTPMTGFLLMDFDSVPYHYRVGLCVFVSVPTTLTIGVAVVEQAGGNVMLALLLTILTNLLGVVTVPFAVRWTIGSSSDVSIDAVQLLVKLGITLLIPLVLGKALRDFSESVGSYVSRHRTLMSLIKNGACVAIVWLATSHSRKELTKQKVTDILMLAVLCSVMHGCFFLFNLAVGYAIGIRDRELIAVTIMASQKSFAVSVAVIAYLDPDTVGETGLLTVPCIVAHMAQLFIDSLILSYWKFDPM